MKNYKIEPQPLLSTLWVFILFNLIIRDLNQFLNEGYLEEMMSLRIAEELMLFYGFIAEISISMVLLSRILSNNANKWANIFTAVITSLGILSTLPSADMDDIFFMIIELAAFIAIIRIAWKLPAGNDPQFQT